MDPAGHGLGPGAVGPGLASGVLAFGCDATTPLLGGLCRGSELRSFALLTLAAWAVMVPLWLCWLLLQHQRRSQQAPSA